MNANPPLSNLQLELLKTFQYQLSEAQLLEIRALLAAYFAEQALTEVDRLWVANGWNEEKLSEWANAHLRTPYTQRDEDRLGH